MRKKTIKSYFFNQTIKNPAVVSMFCFSKRSMKQNRQLPTLKQRIRLIKSKWKASEMIRTASLYKRLRKININIIQWSVSKQALPVHFLQSFYTLTNYLRLNRRKSKKYPYKILLWFIFKKRFNKFMRQFIRKFVKTGVLSSHFVHILSKKNLTYQTRSKYRAKMFNLNNQYMYIYTYGRFLSSYVNNINHKMYFFTANPAKEGLWTDEDHYLHTSSWTRGSDVLQKVKKYKLQNTPAFNNLFQINPYLYSTQNYKLLISFYDKIMQYILESDKQKKEILKNELYLIIDPVTMDIIQYVNVYLKPEEVYMFDTLFITLNYLTLYKHIIFEI